MVGVFLGPRSPKFLPLSLEPKTFLPLSARTIELWSTVMEPYSPGALLFLARIPKALNPFRTPSLSTLSLRLQALTSKMPSKMKSDSLFLRLHRLCWHSRNKPSVYSVYPFSLISFSPQDTWRYFVIHQYTGSDCGLITATMPFRIVTLSSQW